MSSAVPTPDHPSSPRRAPRWRRWLLNTLAGLGVLALALVGWAVWQTRHPVGMLGSEVSAETEVAALMGRHFGAHDPVRQGWAYQDADRGVRYIVRVIHQAKMESQDEAGRVLFDGLYVLASAQPLPGQADATAFVAGYLLRPLDGADPRLEELGDRTELEDSLAPAPEDVHFEALSSQAMGWVVKVARRHPADAQARTVSNLVIAPVGDAMRVVARFPASAHYTPPGGCAAAVRRLAERRIDERAAAVAAAASEGEDASPPQDGPEGGDEPLGLDLCSDARWRYSVGPLPSDGWAPLSVTGGGEFNGEKIERSTVKLVFDPGSASYVVPSSLGLF